MVIRPKPALGNVERILAGFRYQEEQVRRVNLLRQRQDAAIANADGHDRRMHRRWPVGGRGFGETGVFILAGVGAVGAEIIGQEGPQAGLRNGRVVAESGVKAGRRKNG